MIKKFSLAQFLSQSGQPGGEQQQTAGVAIRVEGHHDQGPDDEHDHGHQHGHVHQPQHAHVAHPGRVEATTWAAFSVLFIAHFADELIL